MVTSDSKETNSGVTRIPEVSVEIWGSVSKSFLQKVIFELRSEG